jgi:hypothetical protein
VFSRRFGSSGSAIGGEFQVNVYTLGVQYQPAVSMRDDGAFVVTWRSATPGTFLAQIFGRRFNTTGVAVGGEFQVNDYTQSYHDLPSVAISETGRFVVAWDAYLQDDDDEGIFGQLFVIPLAVFDADASGDLSPLTDGLLVLRFLFGFTGDALVSGAVDLVKCRRCAAGPIENYLGAQSAFDIDGDGQQEALTDGILGLRFLFGFTGSALINGAFDEVNCTHCTAPTIANHLKTLL